MSDTPKRMIDADALLRKMEFWHSQFSDQYIIKATTFREYINSLVEMPKPDEMGSWLMANGGN